MNIVIPIVIGVGSFLFGRYTVQNQDSSTEVTKILKEHVDHVQMLIEQNETLKEYISGHTQDEIATDDPCTACEDTTALNV